MNKQEKPQLPPNLAIGSERPNDVLQQYKLTEGELENCKEIITEIQQLCNLYTSLSIQREQILQTIANKQGEQARLDAKIKRRLGLPNEMQFQVLLDKGIIAPMGSSFKPPEVKKDA